VTTVHELSLAEAIADTAVRHADGRPVVEVHVRIGHLRQVVPDALTFAWQLLTEGSELDGAVLMVEHVPAVVLCSECGGRTTLDLPVLACATCGATDVDLESGDEFSIAAIDVVEVA
jgi:hydrogenase nickel incorporation protein HypA/HybF